MRLIKIANNFIVEPKVLEALEPHPRIMKYVFLALAWRFIVDTLFGYHGWQSEPTGGILLSKASHGNLQHYLEANHNISLFIRQKWCRQAAEAIAYIHSQGVIHSDLLPDNYLVHATTPTSLNLWLYDFGDPDLR